MAEELKSERFPVLMSPAELKALDDWAFTNRIRSRGEAVRRLIELGLKASAPESGPIPILGKKPEGQP